MCTYCILYMWQFWMNDYVLYIHVPTLVLEDFKYVIHNNI